ncbi:hypothetical protein DAI22_06g291200 [Oryza sativa Japonica Group]|nr:hypothetical protein DAI22_06g291200 [Oryza sativa Japonica Group]
MEALKKIKLFKRKRECETSRLLKNSTAIASCSFRDEMLQFLGREKNMLC